MTKFIYQIQGVEKNDFCEILLYSVDQEGNIIVEKNEVPYVVYIKKEDYKSLKIEDDKVKVLDDVYMDKNNSEAIKLELTSKEKYDEIVKSIAENQLKSYEGDLSQEYKYLIDSNMSMLTTEGQNQDTNIKMKILSFDIETIVENDETKIVSISLISDCKKKNKVYIVGNGGLKSNDFEIEEFETEKNMIEKFKNDIIDFSPQIILGWNVIDFDFKVLKDRMSYHNIEFKFSKFIGENRLRINEDFFRDSTLTIPGVLVIDGISLLKNNFISCEDYKLDTVASEILGEKKIKVEEDGLDKQESITKLYYENPQKLVKYNHKDSMLVLQIIDKLKLIDLMIKRSTITNTPFLRVKSPILSLDIMYLTKLHKKFQVAETVTSYFSQDRISGAYVLEPESGFKEDVFVFDFKSLYPSIIMTFNIDPFTYSSSGVIKAPNGAKFSPSKGILPKIIEDVYKMRDVAKKEKDDIKSYALKITMNSFYGAMGAQRSRFYNPDVAEAITSFARYLLEKTKLFLEKKGYKSVYGDTDSLFVKFNVDFKDLDEKKEFGYVIEDEINKYFEQYVKDNYARKSYLKIEFEKLYSKFFIASKKRYAGIDEFKKPEDNLDIKGLEAIRGDWTNLAKEFQIEMLKKAFTNGDRIKNIKSYIKNHVKDLNQGKYDDKLVYTKRITKPLEEYTKTTPPHVKAAREVENFKGRIVKYVQTIDGPKHISLIGKSPRYDYKHYQEKQLKGVSDEILDALKINFDEAVAGEKQNSLNKFF